MNYAIRATNRNDIMNYNKPFSQNIIVQKYGYNKIKKLIKQIIKIKANKGHGGGCQHEFKKPKKKKKKETNGTVLDISGKNKLSNC